MHIYGSQIVLHPHGRDRHLFYYMYAVVTYMYLIILAKETLSVVQTGRKSLRGTHGTRTLAGRGFVVITDFVIKFFLLSTIQLCDSAQAIKQGCSMITDQPRRANDILRILVSNETRNFWDKFSNKS